MATREYEQSPERCPRCDGPMEELVEFDQTFEGIDRSVIEYRCIGDCGRGFTTREMRS